MKVMSINKIKEALRYGDSIGYTLFPEIRDKNNMIKIIQHPKVSGMVNDLLDYAKNVLELPVQELPFEKFIEFSQNGNRVNYEKLFFESKKQLHALVMAEIIEDNDKYIRAIQERLWQWCNTYTWELPAHVPLTLEAIKKSNIEADEEVALFSAETAFYFAEILTLIGHKLNKLLVYRLKKEIFRRVIDSYKKRYFWWEEAPMNWASVCAGSIGCTAIYLIDDVHELSILLNRVIGTMETYISGFDMDGVTTEGLAYWAYGFSFFVFFSELLKERTCGKIDLLNSCEKIKKIAELPLYLQFPNGRMINFSDAPGDTWEGEYGLLSRLSKVFDIKEYRFSEKPDIFRDHTSKWAITSRNLFWGLETNKYKNNSTKIGSFYFAESQWLIDRRQSPCGKFYAFAAKGGHNGEPHNHNDLGHFILHYNGQNLLIDLGAPEYTKKFFSKDRYDILHASSSGHSVPIINGQLQVEGTEHQAKVLQYEGKNDFIILKLDLKDAYDITELRHFNRTFIWDYKQLELNIWDEFLFDTDKNTIDEIFISRDKPIIVEPGKVIIESESCDLLISFEASALCEIICDQYTDHFAEPGIAYRTRIKYNSNKELKNHINIKIIDN